jgi:hypothetical protein
MHCGKCGEKGPPVDSLSTQKSLEDRAKPWKEQVDAFDAAQEAHDFRLQRADIRVKVFCSC